MKSHLLWAAVGVCLACPAPMSSAESRPADSSPAGVKAALQADYDALYADARHKNVGDGLRYFARDFIGEDHVNRSESDTPMDWAAIRQIATEYTESSQSITGRAVITSLIVTGGEATATVRHHAVMIAAVGHGRHWRGVFDATTRDTWVHGPQGWRMQRGRGLSLRVERHEH